MLKTFLLALLLSVGAKTVFPRRLPHDIEQDSVLYNLGGDNTAIADHASSNEEGVSTDSDFKDTFNYEEYEPNPYLITYNKSFYISKVFCMPQKLISLGEKLAYSYYQGGRLFALTAPFDGYLWDHFVKEGARTRAYSPLFEIFKRRVQGSRRSQWTATSDFGSNDIVEVDSGKARGICFQPVSDPAELSEETAFLGDPSPMLLYRAAFFHDVVVTNVLVQINQLVQPNQLLIEATRKGTNDVLKLTAPQSGRVVMLNAQQGKPSKARKAVFVIELTGPIEPALGKHVRNAEINGAFYIAKPFP